MTWRLEIAMFISQIELFAHTRQLGSISGFIPQYQAEGRYRTIWPRKSADFTLKMATDLRT